MKTALLSRFGLATLAIAFAPIALAQGQQQPAAPASPSFAGQATRAQFERGYYLQTHEGNLAEAAAAFEHVVADGAAPVALRRGESSAGRVPGGSRLSRLCPLDVAGRARLHRDHAPRRACDPITQDAWAGSSTGS